MPGLRKRRIVQRLIDVVTRTEIKVHGGYFSGPHNELPFVLDVHLGVHGFRKFLVYIWTITHGGRTRSDQEYRIQATLRARTELQIGGGTTLLLGYYKAECDFIGIELGNDVPSGMEVFASWDPLEHLHVGRSSSCQVSFSTITQAHLAGVSVAARHCVDGSVEQVICYRPEYLARYLIAARSGHRYVKVTEI